PQPPQPPPCQPPPRQPQPPPCQPPPPPPILGLGGCGGRADQQRRERRRHESCPCWTHDLLSLSIVSDRAAANFGLCLSTRSTDRRRWPRPTASPRGSLLDDVRRSYPGD